MTKKIIFGLLSLFCLTFCSRQTSEKQLVQADDFKIVINSPDTIGKDQDFFASIHVDNRKYNLIDASFDCNVSDTSTVDTLKGKIYSCNNRLVIEHDSVKIYFTTGQNSGKQKFHDITLLAKSSDNKYYYQKTTFDYFVK